MPRLILLLTPTDVNTTLALELFCSITKLDLESLFLSSNRLDNFFPISSILCDLRLATNSFFSLLLLLRGKHEFLNDYCSLDAKAIFNFSAPLLTVVFWLALCALSRYSHLLMKWDWDGQREILFLFFTLFFRLFNFWLQLKTGLHLRCAASASSSSASSSSSDAVDQCNDLALSSLIDFVLLQQCCNLTFFKLAPRERESLLI